MYTGSFVGVYKSHKGSLDVALEISLIWSTLEIRQKFFKLSQASDRATTLENEGEKDERRTNKRANDEE